MRVLMITTEFPTPEHPGHGIFVARQADALRAAGITVDVLHFISRANPRNHFRAWRRMRRLLAAERYDLIHAQFGHAALISRMQRRLPVVVTYRGDGLQGVIGANGRHTLKGRVLVGLCQLLGLAASQVIVVSERLGRILLRKDYTVIPSGLDLERFRPLPKDEVRRKIGWDLDRPTVLFSAQHIEWPNKRYGLAQSAVDLAAREVEGAQLSVASGVDPQDMPLYINAADVLLLTSIQEGSPNVVKEALACNVPVVAVDVGDVRERLDGVDRGAVCEDTPEALAEALVPLLRHPARADSRKLVSGLTEASIAGRVIEVYRRALDSSGAQAPVGAP